MLRRAPPYLFLLSLVLPMGVLARTAEAHVPPPVYFQLAVTDEQVEFRAVPSFKVFQLWFGIDPESLPTDGALDTDLRTAIETHMNRWLSLHMDGATGPLTLAELQIQRFEDHLQNWQFVHLRMTVPAQMPKQVTFHWRQYDTGSDGLFHEIDAELDAFEESFYPLFHRGEPEFTWHRPRETKRPAPATLPPPPQPPHLDLPVVSLGLLLVLLVALFAMRRRVPKRQLAIALVVGVLAAVPLRHMANVSVPLPGGSTLDRPDDESARTIFAALHHGIYESLGGASEDEIYDALARSVTGELLETLYLDINESMILHDEGGVIAKVRKWEIIESTVLPDHEAGAPWFKINARWRVEGKVGHYAHTHQRINEYLANVTVIAVNQQWRIAEIEVLDETRSTSSSRDPK